MERGTLFLSIGVTAALMLSFPSIRPPRNGPLPPSSPASMLVRVTAVVRDKKGRFVQNLTVRDFEVFDGGASPADHRFRKDSGRDQRRPPLRRQRQHGGTARGRARCGPPRPELARMRSSDEAAVFTFDTRLAEVVPFTTGLKQLPPRLRDDRPVRRDVAARRDRRRRPNGSRRDAGLRRAVVVFTDGSRHGEPSDARRSVGDRERHRRPCLHLWRRPGNRQSDARDTI